MDYEKFADLFSQLTKVQDNTLVINGIRAETLIKEHRQHAISFFNDHIEALKVLSAQGSETVRSRKLLQMYDILLFQIASYFENEEHDTSYREKLTTTMNKIVRDNLE